MINVFNLLLLFYFQVTRQELSRIKDRFRSFLTGETQIAADEAFIKAVESYFEVWEDILLCRVFQFFFFFFVDCSALIFRIWWLKYLCGQIKKRRGEV